MVDRRKRRGKPPASRSTRPSRPRRNTAQNGKSVGAKDNAAATLAPANGDRKQLCILAVDIGGSKIKLLVSGETEPRRIITTKGMSPAEVVKAVLETADGWKFDAVSIGYPGLVGPHGPRSEPLNLGFGWVGFDFATAFERPVRIMNDAAMQALGSYDGGRMLFLGLGTGLGSALISENVIIPLELGQVRDPSGATWGELLGRAGMKRDGKKRWRKHMARIVPALLSAFLADYVVLGGGNSKELKILPPGVRLGNNLTAFRGGFRLWHIPEMQALPAHESIPQTPTVEAEWRLI